MNKNIKYVIIAAIIIIPAIVYSLQMHLNNPGEQNIITTSTNTNNQILPVVLGSTVSIDSGNITATTMDPSTGTFYVIYFKTENNISNLYLVRSDDGKTFSQPVRVNDVQGDATPDDVSPPAITVASNGEVYILWTTSEYSDKLKANGFPWGMSSLRLAHSTDGGQTFSKAIHVAENEGSFGRDFENLAVAPDGKTVYVGWLNDAGYFQDDPSKGNGSPVVVARSTDGGNTFQHSIPVDNSPSCPCCKVNLVVDKDGTLYVSWRKIF
jgi:hypothetical protein